MTCKDLANSTRGSLTFKDLPNPIHHSVTFKDLSTPLDPFLPFKVPSNSTQLNLLPSPPYGIGGRGISAPLPF